MKRVWTLPILMAALSAGAQDGEKDYQERVSKLHRNLAAAHGSIGKWLKSKKMYQWANEEFRTALKIDAECEIARENLGYRKDGDGKWQFDPTVRLRMGNEKSGKAADRTRKDWERKRISMGKKYSKEFSSLASWCEKNAMKERALAHHRLAVEYDPNNGTARKALGYERRGKGGGWISPFEKELREKVSKELSKRPKGAPRTEATDAEKGMGLKFTKLESPHFIVESPHMAKAQLEDLVQYAEHAYALWHLVMKQEDIFGGKKMEFCILKDKAQHETFVDRFHQGSPQHKALAKRSAGMGAGWIQECYQDNRSQPVLQDYVVHYTVQTLQGTFAAGQRSMSHNPIWCTEGTALYFTKLIKNTAIWSCVDLTKSGTGGQKASKDPKDWPFIIKTFIGENKDPDITAVIQCTNFAELSGPETVKAWSIVDFLLVEFREKYLEFCKDLRTAKDNGTESFKKVFGWTLEELDSRWRAYAKQAYVGL